MDAVAFEPAPAEPPAGIIPSAQLTGAIATYQDPVVGYAIDYPQGWYTQGDPGGPVTLTSFPLGNEGHGGLSADQAKIDLLPAKPGECSTLQQLVDDTRSQAKIPREEQWLLGGVLPAVRMQIQNDVNGVYGESALLLTVINGRCLRVSGLGDLSQFDAIAASLRPLQ